MDAANVACRHSVYSPFVFSNVRRRLAEMPSIPAVPAALQSVHDIIRKYRNTTIAHSQSNLVMPPPVAILDAEGQGVDVVGVFHPFDAISRDRKLRHPDRCGGRKC